MVLVNCPDRLHAAIEHLTDRFTCTPVAGGWLLTTPWLLPDNTALSVYVLEEDGGYRVTDLGETIDDLFLSGLKLDPSDHRFEAMRARFGVIIDEGVISSLGDAAGLADVILRVSHARLDLAYLVYTRQVQPETRRVLISRQVRSALSFTAAVDRWLDARRVPFERNVEIQGKANPQTFDYLVSRGGRPILLEAISTSRSSNAFERAQMTAFKVLDAQGGDLGAEFDFAALLDDRSVEYRSVLTPRIESVLRTYVPHVIWWTTIDTSMLARER